MTAPIRVGLVHTVPARAARFDADIAADRPDWQLLHIVDAPLLATAIAEGVTSDVSVRTKAHIEHLAEQGAAAILVTCSSIGEAVDAAALAVEVPVVRVDVAMAAEAVALATRAGAATEGAGTIVVLATLEATLGPTGRLLERFASESAQRPTVRSHVVRGAVEARTAGDTATHDALIASATSRAAAEGADVIVLAQASMATAAETAGADVPVLSSPRSAQRALIDAAEGAAS